MKSKNLFHITFLTLIVLFTSSCEDKNGKNENKGDDNYTINEWVYESMNENYYWYKHMPSATSLDFDKDLDTFFKSLLYKRNTVEGERFSYMERDTKIISGRTSAITSNEKVRAHEIGFEFVTLVEPSGTHYYCIGYIMPNTLVADAKKLKRGDIITAVNGIEVDEDNYYSLLYQGKDKYELTLLDGEKVTVNTTSNYTEDPVYYDDILTLSNGETAGYLVYNFFANDNGDKSNNHAIKLNTVMNKFASRNIDHLILDLRYNPGGYVSSGTYLASAIVPGRNTTNSVYTTREYNDKLQNKSPYKDDLVNSFEDKIGRSTDIARLEMKKLYVLTSQNTASASEQIINGLRVLLPGGVVIIGETTTGKNMESFNIPDKNNKNNKWILHPLTSKSFNSKDKLEYSHGFKPTVGFINSEGKFDFELSEFYFHQEKGKLALYPLGDNREILLAKAIQDITGQNPRMTRSASEKVKEFKVISSSIERKSNALIVDRP